MESALLIRDSRVQTWAKQRQNVLQASSEELDRLLKRALALLVRSRLLPVESAINMAWKTFMLLMMFLLTCLPLGKAKRSKVDDDQAFGMLLRQDALRVLPRWMRVERTLLLRERFHRLALWVHRKDQLKALRRQGPCANRRGLRRTLLSWSRRRSASPSLGPCLGDQILLLARRRASPIVYLR